MAITAQRAIDAEADRVFELITDPRQLHTWNQLVRQTVDAPGEMTAGAQWIVEMHAMGQTWRSISPVTAIDRAAREFAYRSGTDDGNPSYADWKWHITPAQAGCIVAVAADFHPATFWRRVLIAKMLARQLQRELPDSLDRLAKAVATA